MVENTSFCFVLLHSCAFAGLTKEIAQMTPKQIMLINGIFVIKQETSNKKKLKRAK